MARVALTDDTGALYGAPATWLNNTFSLKGEGGGDLTSFRSDLMHRAFAPPAPEDTPTVTVLNSADSPLRATGNEVLISRIDGTNATGADIAGDPSFLIEGTPAMGPYGSGTIFVQTGYLPGGSTNQANYAASIETLTEPSNQEIEFLVMAPASSFGFRAYVDGHPLSVPQQLISGVTAGNWYTLRFVFPVAKARRVKLLFAGRPPIAGAYVPTGEALTRPPLVGPRVAIIADSYGGGSGSFPEGGNRIETGAYLAAHILGAGSIWNFAIGGTGYVATDTPFQTRVDAMLASNPDILIVAGSVNDGSNDYAELRTALQTFMPSVSAVPEVYITGPAMNAGFEGNNTAVREEAEAAGYTYIDPLNPEVWLDPDMIGADGVHPNKRGHIRTANRLAAGIIEAREFEGFAAPSDVVLGGAVTPPSGSTTVFSDDFNRADADTLGTDWTVANGTAGIRSNAAGVLTASGTAYVVRSAQANGVLKATLSVAGTGGGPYFIARYFASSAADCLVVRRNGSGNWAVQKRVSSVATYVHESTTPVANGDRMALTMNGTTITLTVNDVQLWSGTITENASNTLAGFGAWSSIMDYRVDDIAFETLPA